MDFRTKCVIAWKRKKSLFFPCSTSIYLCLCVFFYSINQDETTWSVKIREVTYIRDFSQALNQSDEIATLFSLENKVAISGIRTDGKDLW